MTFHGNGRRLLVEDERIINVFNVILEKKINDIIPDILLETDIGQLIVEIYVTHEIDIEKKRKIKRLDIPTIEINLSKFDRNITKEVLCKELLFDNSNKDWIYNGKREITYKKFLDSAEWKLIIVRNYASHVDYCPIKKRMWKGKPYANFLDDCYECDFFVGYKRNEDRELDKILCSGKARIGSLEDFELSLEERVQQYDEKIEEEKYELIARGRCPQCGGPLKIRQGKYGEFFGCSNYPHCRFTFSYGEEGGK